MIDKKTHRLIRKEIYIVAVLFFGVFIAMMVYYVNYLRIDSKEFIYNAYNSRFSVFTDDVVRGNIYTADGKAMAKQSLMMKEMKREFILTRDCFVMRWAM